MNANLLRVDLFAGFAALYSGKYALPGLIIESRAGRQRKVRVWP